MNPTGILRKSRISRTLNPMKTGEGFRCFFEVACPPRLILLFNTASADAFSGWMYSYSTWTVCTERQVGLHVRKMDPIDYLSSLLCCAI